MEIILDSIKKALSIFIPVVIFCVAFCSTAVATVLPVSSEFIKKVTGDVIVKSPNDPATFTVRVIDGANQPMPNNEVNYSLVCDKKVKSNSVSNSDDKGFSSWTTKINHKGDCVVYAKITNGSTVEFKVKAAEIAPPWLPDKIIFILALLTTVLTALLIAREYIFGLILFGKNKKRFWGLIYDSQSGASIDRAIIRLYDAHSDRLISTTISNDQGKYGFSVQSGTFYMKIISQGFERLDRNYSKDKIELKYRDNNFGEVFSINETNRDVIVINQPLICNNDLIKRLTTIKFRTKLLSVLGVCLWIFLISGTILSGLALYYSNITINFIVVGVYLLLWIFLLRNILIPKCFTKISDSDSKKPLSDILVQFCSSESKIIRSMVSDKAGEFKTLLPRGEYQIYCISKDYILAKSMKFNLAKHKNKISIELKKNLISNKEVGNQTPMQQQKNRNVSSSDEIIQRYQGDIGR